MLIKMTPVHAVRISFALFANFMFGETASCNFSANCDLHLNVHWWSIAPYIYREENGNIVGFFPKVLDLMVNDCCGECTRIVYNDVQSSESQVLSDLNNDSSIRIPVYGTLQQLKILQKPYLPMIESPGIVYLASTNKRLESASTGLLTAVSHAWPVMFVLLLGALVSGIIVWALDCYWNPQQFPVNFFKGSWDGFWWACVSMTTVGYGDRAPKSLSARIFAFIWVLSGLVIIIIFNGAMTAQLTSVVMANFIMQGEQVVIIKNTAEQKFGLSRNLNVTTVNNVKELRNKILEDADISGALIDSYVAGHHRAMLSTKKGIRITDVIDHTYTYGMLLTQGYENSEMKKCFLRYLMLNRNVVTNVIEQSTETLELPEQSLRKEKSRNLLDPSSKWFIEMVSICCGIIVFCVLVGYVWECRRKMKQRKDKNKPAVEVTLQNTMSIDELLKRQCLELEVAMENEVERFYQRWLAKKKHICSLEPIYFMKKTEGEEQDKKPTPTYIP